MPSTTFVPNLHMFETDDPHERAVLDALMRATSVANAFVEGHPDGIGWKTREVDSVLALCESIGMPPAAMASYLMCLAKGVERVAGAGAVDINRPGMTYANGYFMGLATGWYWREKFDEREG